MKVIYTQKDVQNPARKMPKIEWSDNEKKVIQSVASSLNISFNDAVLLLVRDAIQQKTN